MAICGDRSDPVAVFFGGDVPNHAAGYNHHALARTGTMIKRCSLNLLLLFLSLPVVAAEVGKDDVSAYAEQLLADNFEKDGPGAAVLVTRGDEVLFRGARGSASIELDVPLSADQVFRLGSVTKQFASAAVLKLAEQDRLSLDDTLDKFVPDYPGGNRISVRMLLNHTSGIRSYTDIPGRMTWEIQKDLSTSQLIDSFKNEKPDFAPGSDWNYNNSGYVLVGAVIESVSGMSWHAYLDQTFFKPLQMTHTGYGDETLAVIPGHVMGYTLNGENWALAHYLSMTQPHAAGSLVSSVDDLLRWNLALHTGKLLKASSYTQMTTPIGEAVAHEYGFGIGHGTLRGETIYEHGGGIFGFNTALLYMPKSRISVAVLLNFDQGKQGMAGASTLSHLLAAYAIGKPYPQKHSIPMSIDQLKSYEGVYRIDKDNVRVLRIVDGKLTSQRSGGQRYAMLPIARDDFLFEEGLARMRFERDRSDRVTAMRLLADGEGKGERVPRTREALPKERIAIALQDAAIQRVTGEYANDTLSLKISLDEGKLMAQLADRPGLELFAESQVRFFLKDVDVTLEFAQGEGAASSLTMMQAGQATILKRVEK
jgi:D-alanyl-D-alanine carboxypeptidase